MSKNTLHREIYSLLERATPHINQSIKNLFHSLGGEHQVSVALTSFLWDETLDFVWFSHVDEQEVKRIKLGQLSQGYDVVTSDVKRHLESYRVAMRPYVSEEDRDKDESRFAEVIRDRWIDEFSTYIHDLVKKKFPDSKSFRTPILFTGDDRQIVVCAYIVVDNTLIEQMNATAVYKSNERSESDLSINSFGWTLIQELKGHIVQSIQQRDKPIPFSVTQQSATSFLEQITYDIVRTVYEPARRTVHIDAPNIYEQKYQDLYGTLNIISSLFYEGEGARGSIILSNPDSNAIDVHVTLSHPVALSGEFHKVRKLLEVTNDEVSLLGDGAYIYGIGKIKNDEIEDHSSVFQINFTSSYRWTLHQGKRAILDVAFEKPSFPTIDKSLKRGDFDANINSVFDVVSSEGVDYLWNVTEHAMRQKHGTMIVICDKADREARRLHSQSTPILPSQLLPDLVLQLSAIDGAILFDDKGKCHAIGVILDGIVEEGVGDSGRGARYNAAHKYLNYAAQEGFKVLIIVVSEDGMVDIFPQHSKSDC